MGLASEGVAPNATNCEALKKIVDYEATNGKLATVAKFNPLNFSPDAVALDAAFQSQGGPVSIDWMMRSAMGGLTTLPGTPLFSYSIGKQLNNVIHGNSPFTNIGNPANLNAPTALSYWYYGDNGSMTLARLFAPALAQCGCGK